MRKYIKKVCIQVLPQKVYKEIECWIKYFSNKEFRERCMRKKSYGNKNRDKKFYVFRADDSPRGILSAYLAFLSEMEYALSKKCIPIFDLKNYYLPLCQDEENAYKENAWDYYFRQESGYSLEEVYQSKHVYLGWKNESYPFKENWMKKILNEDEIKTFNRLAVKYMDFSPDIKERAKIILSRVPESKKVLGMALRAEFLCGELLGMELFRGHPKQRNLEETIELARNMMTDWKCDYIFISVEDREWMEAFKKSFGENCLWVERELRHYFECEEPVMDVKKVVQEFENVSIRKRTIDYLTEVYVLSQCDDLFGSLSSGMTVAQILNGGKYEHVNAYYNGSIEI